MESKMSLNSQFSCLHPTSTGVTHMYPPPMSGLTFLTEAKLSSNLMP